MSDHLTKELTVLLFTDIVGSVDLQKRLGTEAYTRAVGRHDALINEAFARSKETPTILKETGDGVLAKFATASDAVSAALRIQYLFSRGENWENDARVHLRIGLHLGEVTEMAEEITGDKRAVGMAINLTARIMDLADAGQILITRSVFDDARQYIAEHPDVEGLGAQKAEENESRELPTLQWPAHGRYLFKGHDEPLEIFEAGAQGIAPLVAPEGSDKAKRAVTAEEEATLGWRPGAGLPIPRREDWVVERKVGAGGFGEVWLAHHRVTKEERVFKFCFDPERLRSFKRELTLFRLLRDALGKRKDIAALYEVSVEAPPYYLESEFVPTGNLTQWAEIQGGINTVPMEMRLDILARCARAAAAAHSVGVIHKDIKPSNILIAVEDGKPHPRLSDFGIGTLSSATRLMELGITQVGFTESIQFESESSRTGTRLYSAPEYLIGGAPSVQGDVYSLGVMLYQLVAGDLLKPLGSGWRRDIEDDLLASDIERCIDVEPSRRFETAQELAEHIETLEERRAAVRLEEEQQKQAARRKRLLGFAGVGLIAMAVLASFFAYAFFQESKQEEKARAQADKEAELKKQANATASHLDFLLAGQLLERDKAAAAVAHLARAVRNNPENLAAARKLLATLAMRNFIRPEREPVDMGGPPDRTVRIAVDVSDDGTMVAAAYDSGTKVQVSNLETGERICGPLSPSEPMDGSTLPALQVAFNAKGDRLITNSGKNLRFWDISTGSMVREETCDVGGLISTDGSHWLRQTKEGIELWDLRTFEVVEASLPVFQSVAHEMAFSPDGRILVTIGVTREGGQLVRKLMVLDRQAEGEPEWNVVSTEPGYNSTLGTFYVDPKFTRVAAAAEHGVAKVWSLPEGELLKTLPKPGDEILSMAFTPDARKLVVGYFGNTAQTWDIETGLMVGAPLRHDGGVISTRVTPDGARVVTGSLDATMRVWDIAGGIALTEPLRLFAPPSGFYFFDDGRRVVLPSYDGTAWICKLAGREALGTPVGDHDQTVIAVAEDGQTVAVAKSENVVSIVSTARANAEIPDVAHSGQIQRAQFTNDGHTFVSFSAGEVKSTNLSTGDTETHKLDTRAAKIHAFSPDGRAVATRTWQAVLQDVWLWNLDTPDGEPTQLTHRVPPNFVVLGNGGSRLVVNTAVGGYLWERQADGKYQSREVGHVAYALSISLSEDGEKMLLGNVDDSAQLWDFAVDEAISSPLRHDGPVIATTLHTSDMRPLAATVSASFDKRGHRSAIRVWDLETDQPLAPPIKLKGTSENGLLSQIGSARIRFDADSSRVIMTSGGRAVSWDVAPPIGDASAPLWICDFAEALAGLRLDEKGKPQPTLFEDYLRVREEVRSKPDATELEQWVHWLVTDREARTISPSSSMTSDAYVAHKLRENTESSLREALHIAPGHPTAMAMLAEHLLRNNPNSNDAHWLLERAINFFTQPVVHRSQPSDIDTAQRAMGLTALSNACRRLGTIDARVDGRSPSVPADEAGRRKHLEGAVRFAAEALSYQQSPPQANTALSDALACLGEFAEKDGKVGQARDLYLAATVSLELQDASGKNSAVARTARPANIAFTRLVDTKAIGASPSDGIPLIQKGSTWRYLDDGSDPGKEWRNPDFDDSGWESGPAPLGYGGDGEATEIGTNDDPENRPITVYFRARVQVDDPKSIENIRLRLRRDDAAVVYLNGKEVLRDNLPAGEITDRTLAVNTTANEQERRYREHLVDQPAMVAGENVIAVEVHQRSINSSDIGFDLEITANVLDSRRYLRQLDATVAEDSIRRLQDVLPESIRKRLNTRVQEANKQ